jgi:hypothetical protein
MMRVLWTILLVGLLTASALDIWAQTSADGAQPGGDQQADADSPNTGAARFFKSPHDPTHSLLPFLKRSADDQRQFWLSPMKLRRPAALETFLSFAGLTGALIASDRSLEEQIPGSHLQRSEQLSNYATFSLAGGAASLYALGQLEDNDRQRETGYLSGEAALNSSFVTYVLQQATRRQRPAAGDGRGAFFTQGSSFPSAHAAIAWSAASVLAHEYPGPLTKLVAYGLASAVTVTRVTSKQHFPSDAVVGSALGWYLGRQVYRSHHNPDLGGASWDDLPKDNNAEVIPRPPARMGSPYVPLDSWIYPAFDRLIALGYVRSAILGQRPWTRLECARLLNEANDLLQSGTMEDGEVLALRDALAQEFANEAALIDGERNRSLQVESIYSRFIGIGGHPLTDGYHFGQTITNDFGRPFGEGFNAVDGFSGWTSEGPVTAYFRGEYQHAPSIPAPSAAALQFIATSAGSLPAPPDIPTPAVNRFQPLDAYVSLNVENWQLAFGKQSLWWGPSHDGPLLFSDNALPITMFHIDRVTPFRLPWILGLFGPIKGEFFLGRLSAHKFAYGVNNGLVGQWGQSLSDQPFMDGVKLNFKPSPSFEFGVGLNTMIGGPGVPFTFHKFVQSLFAHRSCPIGSACDPGNRRSSVDFSYRIPGMREWLTFYGDAFTRDEYSPLSYPRKAVFQGGLYMPKLPGIRKLDLNVEGGSTSPADWPICDGCFYASSRFLNGWTNSGNLVGGWVGRASQGEQVSSTYWLSARNTIRFDYRHRKLDAQFIPNGGTVNDGAITAGYWLGQSVSLSGSLQYERWQIPVLDPSPRSNVTASFEIGFWPRDWRLHPR